MMRLRGLVLACIGVLLAAADTYVVVLALPDMMVGIGLDANEFQRATPIVSGFLLGYVAMLPLIGRLSDLFGRTPVLVASLALFSVGSLITAAAGDLSGVVTGRFLQGVGGGGLVPATLALVADLWPAERRTVPLGVVGAIQEFGSLIGPLFGAAILALADWRAIFWINLVIGVLLAVGFLTRRGLRRPRDLPGVLLGLTTAVGFVLTLAPPPRLENDVTIGLAFVPFTDVLGPDSRFETPIAVATLVLLIAFLVREATAREPLLDVKRIPAVLKAADFLGALMLGIALACIVIAFGVADPAKQVLSPAGPWLLAGSALATALFVLHELRLYRKGDAGTPLVPRGAVSARAAWGSLVISLLVGAGLIAALVDVPAFARATIYPDSQVDAALVLVRFLVPVPIGALLGGWLARRVPIGPLTTVSMALSAGAFVAMSGWGQNALHGSASDIALIVCGLGFGLVIAPVNAALLAATPDETHGVASALLVVARMVGMLVGISTLTAVGLHQFWKAYHRIPGPEKLCPERPTACQEYVDLVREQGITLMQTVFLGAAVCCAAAAILALVVLPRRRVRRAALIGEMVS